MNQLMYRRSGDTQWSQPIPTNETAPEGAVKHAEHITRYGVDGQGPKVGRMTDWRFLRDKVCIKAWSMVVAPL